MADTLQTACCGCRERGNFDEDKEGSGKRVVQWVVLISCNDQYLVEKVEWCLQFDPMTQSGIRPLR